MNSYFATFPAGCYEIIIKNLKSFSHEEFEIIDHDESSVSFNSLLPIERLIEIRFFTNVYQLIRDLTRLQRSRLKGDYFRLMKLKDGLPVVLESAERTSIEMSIIKKLDLKPSARLSLNDFYLIERSNNAKFLSLRLSRAKFKREELQPGEVRPELANILCLAAGIKPKDTVLDMFAGYGAIPLEAVRGFGCKEVIAVDTQLLHKRHEQKGIVWHQTDARQLDFIADGSVARIVTDPPWGTYGSVTDEDLGVLYTDAAKEMQRLLRPGGIAVILSGWNGAELILTDDLNLIAKWSVLVSGKKATIYKLQK